MSLDAVRLAAADNADWCKRVWSSHGIGARLVGGTWVADRPTPTGYPEAVVVDPAVTSDQLVLALGDLLVESARVPALSVKDSFAQLDLTAYGWRTLLDGSWIVRSPQPPTSPTSIAWAAVTGRRSLARWLTGRANDDAFRLELLADTAVELLAELGTDDPAGFALSSGTAAVGLSNLRAGAHDPAEVWRAAVGYAIDTHPHRVLVGWETSDDLAGAVAQGFEVAGPLRVWITERGQDAGHDQDAGTGPSA